MSTGTSNVSSHPAQGDFPVIDLVFPGYSIAIHSFLGLTGIDLSFYVPVFATCWFIWTAVHNAVLPFLSWILRLCTSTMVVEDNDRLYRQALTWLQEQGPAVMGTSRAALAKTYNDDPNKVLYNDDENIGHGNLELDSTDIPLFNFSAWEGSASIKYIPYSSKYFYYRGNIFFIERWKMPIQNTYRVREDIFIGVLWLSIIPIDSLLQDLRRYTLWKEPSLTEIWLPNCKPGQDAIWKWTNPKASRDIRTVILEDDIKTSLLTDMNTFLQPSNARWYANRGIPYRRGFLFHGPPGTGKTSLGFALAGLFELPLYALSLSNDSIGDDDLIVLLNNVPPRCIVMLEDIDAVGLSRSEPENENKVDKTACSLSGLLNALDGVASTDGRILIMTTNYPEKLDKALIREGRVDLKVEIGLASTQQVKGLFLLMYSADINIFGNRPKKLEDVLPKRDYEVGVTDGHNQRSTSLKHEVSGQKQQSQSEAAEGEASGNVVSLADQFATIVPAKEYALSEIQGFLLLHQKNPRKAVEEAPLRFIKVEDTGVQASEGTL
jgi:chaperone BCS1